MALLQFEALPPRTTKGTLVRLVTQVGHLERGKIGAIELRGRTASMEVPDRWASRLVKVLDGANLGHQLIRVWHDDPAVEDSAGDHLSRFLRLIEIEAEAEISKTRRERRAMTAAEAERNGRCLVDLVARDETAGLGGRCLVTLAKSDPGRSLPWTRLGAGNPVLLSVQTDEEVSWRGVVSKLAATTIEIAITQPLTAEARSARLRLDHSSDEVARQRQRLALQRARAARGDRLCVLRRVLLGEQAAGLKSRKPIEPLDKTLNASQIEAIQVARSAEDLAIIHGPPGTGKTTTVVELIRQALRSGEKVLACAPSNLAVDNLVERLITAGEPALRLGHPARVLPQLRGHTLDLMVEEHSDIKLAKKLTRDAYAQLEKAHKFTRAKPLPGERQQQRAEARQMLDDARRIEAQVVQQLLDSADVLCATLTGLDSDLLGKREFDLVVIDEACQSTEPACWIPLPRSHRLVLAGDHCQLPPTVVSSEAAREGLQISLLERLMQSVGQPVSRQLTVQYRMNQEIMGFSSAEFYGDSLVADETVRAQRLSDLPAVSVNEFTRGPLTFIDTAGAGYDDHREADGQSHLNPSEAELVIAKAKAVLGAGLAATEMAIIAPYAAQVRYLREQFPEAGLEIDTVDGFQGREKEVILISLVRSNRAGEIGFLSDTRRMNVALTRARRKLIVVGDSATIANHPFYERLLEYMERQNAYGTVWDEVAEE